MSWDCTRWRPLTRCADGLGLGLARQFLFYRRARPVQGERDIVPLEATGPESLECGCRLFGLPAFDNEVAQERALILRTR